MKNERFCDIIYETYFIGGNMLNIVNISLPSRCRIICISDLHTHWQETKKLLEHCNYKPDEDYLFILGDILERGDDNINALRYVM